MKIFMTLILLFVISPLSFAKEKHPTINVFSKIGLPVGKGTEIKILDYDARLGGVLQAVSVKEPGEGFIYTNLQYLIESNPELEKYRKRPFRIKNKVFKLKQKLITLEAPLNK